MADIEDIILYNYYCGVGLPDQLYSHLTLSEHLILNVSEWLGSIMIPLSLSLSLNNNNNNELDSPFFRLQYDNKR